MSKFGEMRQQLSQWSRTAAEIRRLAEHDRALVSQVQRGVATVKESQVLQRLAEVPIESMRDATDTSLRLEALRKFGLTSVASIYLATVEQLERIHGISADGVRELKTVAQQMYTAIEQSLGVSFDADDLSGQDVSLLENVRELDELRSGFRGSANKLSTLTDALDAAMAQTRPLRSRLRWWLSDAETRQRAMSALSDVAVLLGDPGFSLLLQAAHDFGTKVVQGAAADAVQRDFQLRAADYYAVIEDAAGTVPQLGRRLLDDELLQRIDEQTLDTGLVKATLRRYQVFGSKFALTQNRVIIGDEMGLGKTMQALGVLAQRQSEGASHFLVVCPASVLVNWQREIETRSDLPYTRIHGETQKTGLETWRTNGGIAVTTFDTIKTFALTDEQITAIGVDTVVVDEAHYVKNLATGRAQHLARWLERVPRVIFLTGTPLENRVDEFINLASLLDQPFAVQLNRAALASGADTFRQHVAPMYLRRNVQEVLTELPDLIEIDEHCTWEGANYPLYMEGVANGNLMSMRRAGMLPSSIGRPANKMERLLELVEEAFSNGQKVLVYSYFRDVLEEVTRALGSRAVGPITGDVPPARRQALVDAFTEAREPRVLVGQIQAAGTGLNIQAASVVILCEPQIKPSLEVQAVARAHRMGQVRKVQVHRLLIPDSVDSVMTDMLQRKQYEFDVYARESELADAVSMAKDRSEEALANVIVLEERRRLHMDSHT